MTGTDLLQSLKAFIEHALSELRLPVRNLGNPVGEAPRPPHVYLMRLPERQDLKDKIPYILLQFIEGEDIQPDGAPRSSLCTIRLIFAVYDRNGQESNLRLLELMERVRFHLLKTTRIGGKFILQSPLERIVYPDMEEPCYAIGEMMTKWTAPSVEMEVNYGI